MLTAKKLFHLHRYALILILALTAVTGCQRAPRVQPETEIPGYAAELVFEDNFDKDLSHWTIEGPGQAIITEDQRLQLLEDSLGQGMALWSKSIYDGSFMLECEIDFPSSDGTMALFICSVPTDGSNWADAAADRSGALADYIETINSYQVDVHCYTPEGVHDAGSKLRKNQGHYMLGRSTTDPCKANRFYLINFAKTGNRLQFFVDNEKIHDLRDRGGFSPVLKEGHIGLWIHGAPGFTAFIDNIRVFKLNPR